MRALLIVVSLGSATSALACTTAPEPSLPLLLRAAVATASLEPGRTTSMMRRARLAALLPKIEGIIGKGAYAYVRDADALDPTLVTSNTWHMQLSATWDLERLLLNPTEPRLIEASGRAAERRAQVLDRVVELWSQRRALDRITADATDADRCEALTALLDILTRGTLSAGSRVVPHTPISLPDPLPATR